ncbi:MAG: hypothetical protein ACT4QD_22415 [Acidobacteriota bacterium]
MSRTRWVASVLIVYHVTTLLVTATPRPEWLNPPRVRAPRSTDVHQHLTFALDRAGRALVNALARVHEMLHPLRLATAPYAFLGIGRQQWSMFTLPFTDDLYLRIDHYATDDSLPGSQRLFRGLLLPADHEEELKLLHAPRDKAVMTTVEIALDRTAGRDQVADTPFESDEYRARAVRMFAPLARYSREEARPLLAGHARVVRSEVWWGTAPIPPRGQWISEDVLAARLAAIAPYRDALREMPITASVSTRLGATRREADLTWTLLYIDEP